MLKIDYFALGTCFQMFFQMLAHPPTPILLTRPPHPVITYNTFIVISIKHQQLSAHLHIICINLQSFENGKFLRNLLGSNELIYRVSEIKISGLKAKFAVFGLVLGHK